MREQKSCENCGKIFTAQSKSQRFCSLKCSSRRKAKEYVGKKFGKLTVFEIVESADKYRRTMYRCKCDCGNTIIVSRGGLRQGNVTSCGCVRMKYRTKLKNGETNTGLIHVDGTELTQISKTTPSKNSTTGHRGVWYDKSRGKYCAELMLRGKKIRLGRYENIEDAIEARKQGEEEYFKPILEANGYGD